MEKEFEFTGKTIDKAISEGLKTLNKNQEDVDIKVVSEGGLFKKAKIIITIEVEDEKVEEPKTDTAPKKEVEVNLIKEVEKPEEKIVEKVEVAEEPEKEISEEKKEAKSKYPKTNSVVAKEFLEGYLTRLGINGTVTQEDTEEFCKFTIESDKDGLLIGYRGEGLNALQYITNNVEQRQNRDCKRILVNVANYRDKRDESLKELAVRTAKKVLKTKRKHEFEPMTAYERRVIHTALQDFNGITTYSEGVEPRRRLVVDLDKKNR